MNRVVAKCIGVLLVPVVLALTGCGVATNVADPTATAGVERCGTETRACWQVKQTVEVEEYPAAADAAPVTTNQAAGGQ